MSLGLDELRRRRLGALRRQLTLFGTGPADPTLFAVGPRPDLIGRPVAALQPGDGPLSAEVRERDALDDVDLSDDVLPTRISGKLSKGGDQRSLALALNGVIVATTQTYTDGDGDEFAALVPQRALRNGGNELELFDIGSRGKPLEEIAVD